MFISDDLTAAWKMTDNCWDQSDAGPPRGLGWGAGGGEHMLTSHSSKYLVIESVSVGGH